MGRLGRRPPQAAGAGTRLLLDVGSPPIIRTQVLEPSPPADVDGYQEPLSRLCRIETPQGGERASKLQPPGPSRT